MRLLDMKEVTRRVKLSKCTVYLRIAEGKFPKQIHIGANTVAWLESDIDQWIVEELVLNGHVPWGERATVGAG